MSDMRTNDRGEIERIAGQPAGREWPAVAVAAIVGLPLVTVSQFIAHLSDGVLDDHLFGYYGWRISEGARLYRDVWDHKPPGTFWINAAGFWMSRGAYSGVIAICAATQVATLGILYCVARQLFRPSATGVVTVLGAVYLAHSQFFGGGNRSETYLVACQLGAAFLYLRGWRRRRAWHWLGAGVLGGAAFLMKQNGVSALAAILIHLLAAGTCGRIEARQALGRAVQIMAGFAVIVLITGIVLVAQGLAGEAWNAIVTANRVYLAIEPTGAADASWWWMRLERSGLPLLKLPLLLAVAAVARHIASIAGASRQAARTHPPGAAEGMPLPMTLLGTWLVLEVLCAIAAPLPSAHYVVPVLPPLLLIGGSIINAIILEGGLLETIRRRALATALLVIGAYFAGDAVMAQLQRASVVWWARQPRFEGARLVIEPTAAERVGADLNADTEPEECIQCWDYMPGVSLAAKRLTASRFPDHLRAEWAAAAGVATPDEFASALRAAAPSYIVIRTESLRGLSAHATTGNPSTAEAAKVLLKDYTPLPARTIEGTALLGRRLSDDPANRPAE